jgi:putative membrane protein
MRTKTIFIVLFTVLITIFLMMNTDAVDFNILFADSVKISKLLVIGICTFIGFVLGYWAGRPKTTVSTYDERFDHKEAPVVSKGALSDEDRDYIS